MRRKERKKCSGKKVRRGVARRGEDRIGEGTRGEERKRVKKKCQEKKYRDTYYERKLKTDEWVGGSKKRSEIAEGIIKIISLYIHLFIHQK